MKVVVAVAVVALAVFGAPAQSFAAKAQPIAISIKDLSPICEEARLGLLECVDAAEKAGVVVVSTAVEGGVPLTRVAAHLNMGESTLTKWLLAQHAESPEPLNISEREELKQLRKENAMLRMERDISRKATSYFAKVDG